MDASLNSAPNSLHSYNSDGQSKFHTMYTKRLTNEPNASAESSDVVDHRSQSACSLNDFIGGLLDERPIDLHQKQQTDHDSIYDRSITATPADSSCGFHNTFSVLEQHLSKSKLSQQQIENLLLRHRYVAVHNDSYIDIPINRSPFPIRDVNVWDVGDADSLTSFDLELEAMERLRLKSITPTSPIGKSESSDNAFTSTPQAKGYPPDERDEQSPNEYMYHVAKARNGELYIRVKRNLRLDEGKLGICNCSLNLILHFVCTFRLSSISFAYIVLLMHINYGQLHIQVNELCLVRSNGEFMHAAMN